MSQSGETADVCTLLESNRDFFKNSLSLVNNNDSRLVRESRYNINLECRNRTGCRSYKNFFISDYYFKYNFKTFNKKKIENILLPKISLLNKLFSQLEKNIKEIKKIL